MKRVLLVFLVGSSVFAFTSFAQYAEAPYYDTVTLSFKKKCAEEGFESCLKFLLKDQDERTRAEVIKRLTGSEKEQIGSYLRTKEEAAQVNIQHRKYFHEAPTVERFMNVCYRLTKGECSTFFLELDEQLQENVWAKLTQGDKDYWITSPLREMIKRGEGAEIYTNPDLGRQRDIIEAFLGYPTTRQLKKICLADSGLASPLFLRTFPDPVQELLWSRFSSQEKEILDKPLKAFDDRSQEISEKRKSAAAAEEKALKEETETQIFYVVCYQEQLLSYGPPGDRPITCYRCTEPKQTRPANKNITLICPYGAKDATFPTQEQAEDWIKLNCDCR